MRKASSLSLLSYLLPLLIGLAIPLFVSKATVGVLTDAFSLALIALSVGFLLAYVGMPSFGQAAFQAVASYTAALSFLWYNIPPIFSFLIGVAMGVALGFALAPIVTRLRGIYFAIITLATGEVIHRVIWFTKAIGGSDGLGFPVWVDLIPGYYLALFILFGCCLLQVALDKSSFSRILKAIKENEVRAGFIGYRTSLYKAVAFGLYSLFPAIAGSYVAAYRGYVSPGLASVEVSATAVVAALLGGVGSLIGPIAISILLTFLYYSLSRYWLGYLSIIGLSVILVVLLMPEGIVPMLRKKLSSRLIFTSESNECARV